jgi:hypothetical protein
MAAKQLDLVIEQGKTFSRVIRWETENLVWRAITAIDQVAPMRVTSLAHGIPDGWRAAITDVVGMLQANALHTPPWDNELQLVAFAGASAVLFPNVSAASFDPYESGGYLVYYDPADLAGMTARMKIKDQVGGNELESIVTKAGTGFVIDDLAKTITLTITPVDTALFEWQTGVYDLEMVDGSSGDVVAILSGAVTVTEEVTTA